MKSQVIKIAACALLAAVCITSGAISGNLENIMNLSSMSINSPAAGSSDPVFEKSTKHKFSTIKKGIANYKAVNKEVVGWLIVPGTNINEPVTFSNKSNDYYLYRDWTGKNYPDINYKNWNQRPATATYFDCRTVLGESWRKGTSRNLVLYGHNWNNLNESSLAVGNKEGYTMFAQLPSYVNPDFARANPYIYFSTANEEGIWKVFSVAYVEQSVNFPYNSPNPSKAYFKELVQDLQLRSLYNFNTDVNENDRILTLSTCTRQFNVGDQQRFIVVARLLREGESEKDKVKLTQNTKYKAPRFR